MAWLRTAAPLLLPLLAGAVARAPGTGSAEPLADAQLLLQTASSRSEFSPLQPWQSSVPGTCGDKPRNLVVVYDGTFQNRTGMMWNLTQRLVTNHAQVAYYEPGVSDLYGTGFGSMALSGYRFLAENYCAGDKVFILGQSRGCLGARYLQGLMHRHGIARRAPSTPDWDKAFTDRHHLEALLGSGILQTVPGVQIEVLGCMDGVLRGLFDEDFHFQDTSELHLQLTPLVRNLFHALALEEVVDFNQAAEFVADPSTHAEQVWFMGDHVAMCEDNSIALSWLLDRAQGAGLLLKQGWAETLDLNFRRGAPYKPYLPHRTVVRNPVACRAELYGSRPVSIHKSVKERMDSVKGWIPQTVCCHPEVLFSDIDWVTSPTYEARKSSQQVPQWLALHFRVTLPRSLSPMRMLLVTSGFGDTLKDLGSEELRDKEATVILPHPVNDHLQLPPAISVLEGPCLECPGEVFKLPPLQFGITASGALVGGALVTEQGESLQVALEPLYDDDAASLAFRQDLPARCTVLFVNSPHPGDLPGLSSICTAPLPEGYPRTCEELRVEATVGIQQQMSARELTMARRAQMLAHEGPAAGRNMSSRQLLERVASALELQRPRLAALDPSLALLRPLGRLEASG